jgi:hypothetical protein
LLVVARDDNVAQLGYRFQFSGNVDLAELTRTDEE